MKQSTQKDAPNAGALACDAVLLQLASENRTSEALALRAAVLKASMGEKPNQQREQHNGPDQAAKGAAM